MRESVTIDLRGAWAEVQESRDMHAGAHLIELTNEEEWLLYLSWQKKGQEVTTRALGHGRDFLRRAFERLQKQGGPKGKRPEWMK